MFFLFFSVLKVYVHVRVPHDDCYFHNITCLRYQRQAKERVEEKTREKGRSIKKNAF